MWEHGSWGKEGCKNEGLGVIVPCAGVNEQFPQAGLREESPSMPRNDCKARVARKGSSGMLSALTGAGQRARAAHTLPAATGCSAVCFEPLEAPFKY